MIGPRLAVHMLMIDVNVLVYAHRGDERTHQFYRQWLESLVRGPEPFALSVLTAVAFVRIVTNSRIFTDATSPSLAIAVIEHLLEQPSCRLLVPGDRHWRLCADLISSAGSKGKHVADAQHAAVAMEYGCTWVTRDRDFGRFEPAGLRWQLLEPLAPSS